MRFANITLNWLKGHNKLLTGVIAGVFIGGLGSVVVFASIPGAGGVIHGCRNDRTHVLRVIDTGLGQTCGANETGLNWNQTGPQGPPGPGGTVSNLVGADFMGADLHYRDFSNMDMHNANFKYAKLTGSNLSGANASGALFGASILANIDATGANFTGVAISGGSTPNAIFRNVNFTNASVGDIDGGDFTGSTFTGANLYTFRNAKLQGIDFRQAVLQNTPTFSNDNLIGANFRGMTLGIRIGFGGATSGSDVSNADFTNVVFNSGGILNSTATATHFSGAQLTDISFAGTNLSSATLTSTIWSNVTCPDGTNSDNNGNTCVGHLVP